MPIRLKGHFDVKQANSATASVLIGTLVGMVFFLGGYLLCVGDHKTYGDVMFILVPFVSGLTIAALVRPARLVAACCAATCLLSLIILISIGMEGYICCLMALPILLLGFVLGGAIGFAVRRHWLDKGANAKRNTTTLLLLCPLLLSTANSVEKPWRSMQRQEVFEDEIVVPTTPSETWDLLVRMPRMDGPKPFLLWAGLPIPDECTLDGDANGALRVCHFNLGVIEQQVTDWQKPTAVAFKITKSTLPGRRWLTFVDADYQLIPDSAGTKVIRRTTIASRLYPRWYWRPFEAWGVHSEHQYVLSSLRTIAETEAVAQ
ncbi:MAG TPA: hypothetical protein VGM76_09870 [Lacipirellulaceae bacterium]